MAQALSVRGTHRLELTEDLFGPVHACSCGLFARDASCGVTFEPSARIVVPPPVEKVMATWLDHVRLQRMVPPAQFTRRAA